MKKSIIAALTVALTTGLFAGAASADPRTPWVDARQGVQAARIGHGVANGSLNGREAAALVAGQARSRAMERRFRADGVVTRGERARLHHQLNHQNRRIWRFKHN